MLRSAYLFALTLATASAPAQDNKVLNLYTARHYQTDEALYTDFTKQTGIRINRIEGGEDALAERLKAEGANSPADVFLTVDMGRLWRADQDGLFAPIKSAVLESRIPAHLRDPDGRWYAFSARARLVVYNKDLVKPGEVRTYADLADPKWKGKVCVRSGAHPYQLSLTASMVARDGEARAEQWLRGLVANLARDPKGGDTDQIKSVASGECALALANQYYVVRVMRSTRGDDRAAAAKISTVLPNQETTGTHINISGGGMVKHAPNKEAARRFLEYLASDEAQRYFADGNNEWPTVPSVKIANPELAKLGDFRMDTLPVIELGRHQAAAQRLSDRVGYK